MRGLIAASLLATSLPATSLLAAGCGDPQVLRVVDGRAEAGRFISERAYALYARGADAEAAGDLDRAEQMYLAARESDPESPEIWARLGALRCARSPAGDEATASFSRALAIDPAFAPALRERARCAMRRGDSASALTDARAALALDPDDLQTGLTHAEALAHAGNTAEASRAARALGLRHPSSREARQLFERSLERSSAPPSPLAALDAAILSGDLPAAERHARSARLPSAEIAVRAAALGRAESARDLGALVIAADPADTSARIALAAAADLKGDLPALTDALTRIPKRSIAPSPLARLLFAEILARRVGPEAARAWLGPPSPSPATDDPLLHAADQRVRSALSPR